MSSPRSTKPVTGVYRVEPTKSAEPPPDSSEDALQPVPNSLAGQSITHPRQKPMVTCPHCGSNDEKRWGTTPKGKQRWMCGNCGKRWTEQ